MSRSIDGTSEPARANPVLPGWVEPWAGTNLVRPAPPPLQTGDGALLSVLRRTVSRIQCVLLPDECPARDCPRRGTAPSEAFVLDMIAIQRHTAASTIRMSVQPLPSLVRGFCMPGRRPMDIEHLTGAEAAAHANRARQAMTAGAAHIKPATIRQWASRGHLQPAGIADDGRTRTYRLADVARAERATRARALRMVGMGTPDAHQRPTPTEGATTA